MHQKAQKRFVFTDGEIQVLKWTYCSRWWFNLWTEPAYSPTNPCHLLMANYDKEHSRNHHYNRELNLNFLLQSKTVINFELSTSQICQPNIWENYILFSVLNKYLRKDGHKRLFLHYIVKNWQSVLLITILSCQKILNNIVVLNT